MLAEMVLVANRSMASILRIPNFMQDRRELHSGHTMPRLASKSNKKCERVVQGAQRLATLSGCIVRTVPAKISAVPVAHKASS